MNRTLSVLVFLLGALLAIPAAAQENESSLLRVSVGGGYHIGGQFFSESFTYNPGFGAEVGIYHPFSSTVHLGIGAGTTLLMKQERFLPLFVSFIGFMKPDVASNYVLVNVGASAAWRSSSAEFTGYDFNGGMMFKTGFGRRFMVDSRSILVGFALHHQWAEGTFANGVGLEYNENLNFDWLAFEIRFFY